MLLEIPLSLLETTQQGSESERRFFFDVTVQKSRDLGRVYWNIRIGVIGDRGSGIEDLRIVEYLWVLVMCRRLCG